MSLFLSCIFWPPGLPILEVHTWRVLMAPDWRPGGWGHPWRHGSSYVIFYLYAEFKVLTTTPSWKSILGGHWRFLTGVLEVWIILNMLDHLERLLGTYHKGFIKIWLHFDELEGFEKNLIDILKYRKQHNLYFGTLRTLMTPDQVPRCHLGSIYFFWCQYHHMY